MAQNVSAALARKLSASKEDLTDRPRSIPRALRLGFARAAGDALNLPLAVIGVKQDHHSQDDLAGTIEEDWLMLLFNGVGGVAAACLDPNTVSAIVQTQTIGEVTKDAPSSRAFTDTDAAMVAPLIEGALTHAALLVEAAADHSCLAGYEFTSRVADLRSLSLSLIEDAYYVFDLTVDLAGGLRQGQISVLLPNPPEQIEPVVDDQQDTGPSLEHSAGVVRAELNAVLCRMTLPLGGLAGLKVGGVLPLTGSRLDQTEILTIDRTRAGVGRLGQCGGLRAIRLNEHAAPSTLASAGVQEFIESRTEESRQDISDVPPYDIGKVTTELDAADSDLNFSDSDGMVAEISQLAGLPGPEDEPEHSG